MTRLTAIALVCAAALAPRAGAQVAEPEDVYTRASKDKYAYRGFIVQQSPRGITLKGRKELIPADEIDDIVFQVLPLAEARLRAYRPATQAEKTALKAKLPAERTKALAEAAAKYEEALANLSKGQPFAQSHLQFKIAFIRFLQSREDGKDESLKLAEQKLRDFTARNPKAWQTARALRMLAKVQLDLKQYDDAQKTLQQLAAADVAEEARQEAEVQALLVSVQAGKHAEARAKLEALVSKLPKGSPHQQRARLALAECLGLGEKLAEARALVKQVLKETKDRGLRTQAHNTLGYCYYLGKQWQDARWEFLWVDVVYNQDKSEHAKALYYLADIFARLGEGERARECRDLLVGDPQFAGSEYQRRALVDAKSQ